MRTVSLALAVTFALVSANSATAQHRHTGVFAVERGDADDGCAFRWRTRVAVPAWAHPTTTVGRPIRTVGARRLVEPNDRSEALTVTRRPGRAQSNGSSTIEAMDYGATSYLSQDDYYGSGRSVVLELADGDQVDILARGGEGTVFFRYQGRIYSGWLPQSMNTFMQPETRLWVRLTPRGAGRPAAWVNADDPSEFEQLECEYRG